MQYAPRDTPPTVTPDARKQAALHRVWREAAPLTVGDRAHIYLAQRGIDLPEAALPLGVRYHPLLPYHYDTGRRTYHPAMLALVHDPDGHAVTVHRTYLTGDGSKAKVPSPKKLMPPATSGATRGGAIRLYPPGATLAVAEGIETALAVRLATGLPVWATYSAGGMARLIIPREVHLVVICADHDPAGLDAARALTRRLLAEQRRVKILTPETPGADWADRQGVAHG